MTKTVDSHRFLDRITSSLVKNWIEMERPREIPWTPLSKPLTECTVALVSSGGIALKTDPPFDQEGERENPWWGDPTHRVIPHTATERDIEIYHLHINPKFAKQDLNCVLPLGRLSELEEAKEVGRSAPHHYSYMGYILEPKTLLEESVPAIIEQLRGDDVDVVVLVPV
jgi:D-proline reductase (dithiol) PrdB